jgi:hypothetical protein
MNRTYFTHYNLAKKGGQAMHARYTFTVAAVGGLLWGLAWELCRRFQFTDHYPGLLLEPWGAAPWLSGWVGFVLGLASFLVFSLLAGFVYRWLLPRADSVRHALGFGIVCALLLALLDERQRWWSAEFAPDTVSFITDTCLLIQWALFLGLSLQFARSQPWATIGEK